MAAQKVLIVDDEFSIRDMLRMALEISDFQCLEAENIQDAFLYLRQIFTLTGGQNTFMKTNTYLLMTIITGVGILVLLALELRTLMRRKDEIQFSSIGLITIVLLILFFGAFKNQADFIYFQF